MYNHLVVATFFFRIIFTSLIFFILPHSGQAQWIRIDTLYTQPGCQIPVHYRAVVDIPNPDTAYYYFNNEQCSPSGGSNVHYKLYRTTDAFQSWQLVATDSYSSMNFIKFINGSTGFLSKNVFGKTSFMKTTDAGNSWATIDSFYSNPPIAFYDIFMFNADSGYTISRDGILKKYIGGISQTMNINSNIQISNPRIKFTNDNKGFIITRNSATSSNTDYHLLQSVDNGFTWNSVLSDSTGYFIELAFADNTTGYLAGSAGVYKSTDGGTSWNLINGSPTSCDNIAVIDSNTLSISTWNNNIYKSIDGGQSWMYQPMPSNPIPINQNPLDIILLNSNLGYIVAINGIYNELYRNTNGGIIQSIPDLENSNDLPWLYPNPTRNFTKIIMPSYLNGEQVVISIYSITGTCLHSISIKVFEQHLNLDLNEFASGLYFVELKHSNSFNVLKLLIN